MVRRQYTEEDSPYVAKGTKAAVKFNQGLKSTPIYNPIRLKKTAQRHYAVVMGEGINALADMVKKSSVAETMVVISMGSLEQQKKCKSTFSAGNVCFVSDEKELLDKVEEIASQSMMGDAYYLCCPEMYIWKMHQIFHTHAVDRSTVYKWHIGTPKRRVYCCHCKTYNENIIHDIFECSGCKSMIYVYDHFSRLNASYLGFRVDAETPGEIPKSREVYT